MFAHYTNYTHKPHQLHFPTPSTTASFATLPSELRQQVSAIPTSLALSSLRSAPLPAAALALQDLNASPACHSAQQQQHENREALGERRYLEPTAAPYLNRNVPFPDARGGGKKSEAVNSLFFKKRLNFSRHREALRPRWHPLETRSVATADSSPPVLYNGSAQRYGA